MRNPADSIGFALHLNKSEYSGAHYMWPARFIHSCSHPYPFIHSFHRNFQCLCKEKWIHWNGKLFPPLNFQWKWERDQDEGRGANPFLSSAHSHILLFQCLSIHCCCCCSFLYRQTDMAKKLWELWGNDGESDAK